MRIVVWNILHGGGRRTAQIIDQLGEWEPDIVGLLEFRGTPPSQEIAAALAEKGLGNQYATIKPDAPTVDGLMLASRWSCKRHEVDNIPIRERWIHVTLEFDNPLQLILLWVPNRDKSGINYDVHDATVESLSRLASTDALAFGDTNTGIPDIDEEAPFFNKREGQWFRNLADVGWTDIWRSRNPEGREYTWHNHSSGAGFRLDQTFATASAAPRIRDVRYDWGAPAVGKLRGPSDHAAMIIDVE